MSDEPIEVVCANIETAKEHSHGATIGNCSYCDCRIWISQGTHASMAGESHLRYVCYECHLEHLNPEDEYVVIPPRPETIKEIAEHFGVPIEMAQRMVDAHGRETHAINQAT